MKKYVILSLLLILTNKLIASSTDTIPNPNRIVGIEAWKVYQLIHDKQAYEECKIVLNKQKSLIEVGDSLLAIAEGEKVNLKTQVVTQEDRLDQKDIKFDAFKEKKKLQIRKLIKVIIGEAGLIILETVIIILII